MKTRAIINGTRLCECGCGLEAPLATKTNREFGHVKGQPVRYRRGHQSKNKKFRFDDLPDHKFCATCGTKILRQSGDSARKWPKKKYCSKDCMYRNDDRNKNISIALSGENGYWWKGDEVGYASLHEWIRKYKPKSDVCEHCGEKKKLQAANVSGKYLRDFDDWLWLCVKCHVAMDGTIAKANAAKLVFNPFRLGVKNKTGFKGISFDKRRNKWRALIKLEKKSYWLGHFPTAEEAAFAYRVAGFRMYEERLKRIEEEKAERTIQKLIRQRKRRK
jgi:hypothetical protein